MDLMRGLSCLRAFLLAAAILSVCAAMVAFGPLAVPAARAKTLYLDGWFAETSQTGDQARDTAFRCFENALAISPGRCIFQHGLVWKSSRTQLPRILKEHHFYKETVVLGNALMASCGISQKDRTPSSSAISEELRQNDILKALELKNPLGYYRKAHLLLLLRRDKDALAEVCAGNRAGSIHEYYPIVSEEIAGSPADPMVQKARNGDPFQEDSRRYVRISSSLISMAQDIRKEGNPEESDRVLYEACRMAVKVATAIPHTAATYQLGCSLFDDALAALQSGRKNAPQREAIADIARLSSTMATGNRSVGNWLISSPAVESVSRTPKFTASITETFSTTAMIALYAAVVFILWSLLWFAASYSNRESAFEISPFDGNWLVSRLLMLHIPACIGSMYIIYTTKLQGLSLVDESWNDMLPILPIALAQLGLLVLVTRRLRGVECSYRNVDHRLITYGFQGPVVRQHWIAKNFALASSAQVLFLLCVFLLTTIVCKPILGVHPWQLQRLPVYGDTLREERSMIDRVDLKVRLACPREWRLGL